MIFWMRNIIDSIGPEYHHEKKHLRQTVGYENGYDKAYFTTQVDTWDDILDNFLGLGKGLPLTRFVSITSRFGIESTELAIDVNCGLLEIMPSPVRECEVRLRGSATSMPIVLTGHIFSPGLPDISVDRTRFRFDADFLRIVFSPNEKSLFYTTLGLEEKKITINRTLLSIGSLAEFRPSRCSDMDR